MEDITVQAARRQLDDWAKRRAYVDQERDAMVRRALRAGLSKIEIVRRTGIARSTVDRICATSQGFING